MDLRTGMLWYDDASDRSLSDKLARATNYYESKYGQIPTVCYLNADALSGEPIDNGGLKLQAAPDLLPHHFWLGVGE